MRPRCTDSAGYPVRRFSLADAEIAGQDVRLAGAGLVTLLMRGARRNIAVIVSTSPFCLLDIEV
jgi:hypothetical protein